MSWLKNVNEYEKLKKQYEEWLSALGMPLKIAKVVLALVVIAIISILIINYAR